MKAILVRVLLVLLVIVVMAVFIEGILLLRLKRSVGRFREYWQRQNAEPIAKSAHVYVAFGDSTAQGIGASAPEHSYVSLIAKEQAAKMGKEVKVINLSKSGAVVNDVIHTQLPEYQALAISPDLVTISIGANNIINFDETMFRREFDELCSQLPKGTYVADIPWFGGRRKDLIPKASAASKIVREVVARYELRQVDLEQATRATNGLNLYAPDYFHPNNRAYKNWAQAFLAKIGK